MKSRKSANAGSLAALSLALLAVGLSGLACYFTWRGTGAQKPLSAYDFKSPAEAARSLLQIMAEGNVLALGELEGRQKSATAKEKLKSFAVRKEVESEGKRLVFATYQVGGQPRYEVFALEQRPGDRRWYPAALGFKYSTPEKDAVEAWERNGTVK